MQEVIDKDFSIWMEQIYDCESHDVTCPKGGMMELENIGSQILRRITKFRGETTTLPALKFSSHLHDIAKSESCMALIRGRYNSFHRGADVPLIAFHDRLYV